MNIQKHLGLNLTGVMFVTAELFGAVACVAVSVGLYFGFLPEPNVIIRNTEIVTSVFFAVILTIRAFLEIDK